MADLKESIENFKSASRPFKALFEVLDAIEEVGDLQRAAKEAETALTKSQKDREDVVAQIEAAKTSAVGIVEQAQKIAEEVQTKAREEAYAIVADAKSQEEVISGEVVKMKKAMAVKVAEADAKVKDAEAKEQAALVRLSELEVKIANAQANIARILNGVS